MESLEAIGSSDHSNKFANTGHDQFGGSPIKVGEEEYHLFRDHE
jgi:hypothetical protein